MDQLNSQTEDQITDFSKMTIDEKHFFRTNFR